MVDEAIETPAETPPSVEAGAESQETIEETPGAEETPEVQEPTIQEIVDAALEKQSQQIQSWVGRREQEQMERFTQMIADRVKPAEPTPDTSEEVYTDPTKWLDDQLNQRDSKASAHTQKVISSAAKMMDSDPLFSKTTPGGKEFGAAVVKQVAQMLPSIKSGMNVEQGADLLVNKAIAAVMRGKKKDNPLKGNKPATTPLGTVTQKEPPKKPEKTIELSAHMKKYQEARGLSDEHMQKLAAKI